jgi:hypothetical protein
MQQGIRSIGSDETTFRIKQTQEECGEEGDRDRLKRGYESEDLISLKSVNKENESMKFILTIQRFFQFMA